MRFSHLFLLMLLIGCRAAIPPGTELTNIKIARDEWGVPHIIAPTDAEVTYGLAWAECEDDFVTLQEQMAAGKGLLGEINGKSGAIADFAIKFMGLSDIANRKYDEEITGEFRTFLESYTAGANAYAALHPKEVLHKDLFPLTPQDVIVGYLLGNLEVSGAGRDLRKIMNGTIVKELNSDADKGSNAIAISRSKTTDGKTYLAINAHQPLEGWYSWYEAHLISDEGLNILGGTFPGGFIIFHGANEHLGWAHTVNRADFSDVYRLTINPENELQYRFDGEWLDLEEKVHTGKVKIGPLKLKVKRTSYISKYGPTFKTDGGYFAWRFAVGETIRMGEQWYRMNKATNFTEFQDALRIQGITCLNIVYADKEDNIYYLSNGRIPKRDPNFDWQSILPGDTSATVWGDEIVPFDSLPQVHNPPSGWVFNTNNTPFTATAEDENVKETELNKTMGYLSTGLENNRSMRFLELIGQYEKLSYEDFKRIKFDQQYPSELLFHRANNMEMIMQLDPVKYPDIADAIEVLGKWNRQSYLGNTRAPLFLLSWKYIDEFRDQLDLSNLKDPVTEEQCVYGVRKAKAELMKKHGALEVEIGRVQRLIRGDVSLPLGGSPDVLGAMLSVEQKNGQYKGMSGDSYVEMVRFGPDGVEIESIHAYGSSTRKDNKHSTSQMQMFTNQQLKRMSLDREEALKNAVKIYSPYKIDQ